MEKETKSELYDKLKKVGIKLGFQKTVGGDTNFTIGTAPSKPTREQIANIDRNINH